MQRTFKITKLFVFLTFCFSFFFTSFFQIIPFEAQAKLIKVKVKRVIDGDTVVLSTGERLRYAGINTLELHTPEGKPQPFAVEAYLLNKKLTEGKTLYLKLSLRKRDRYGRLLGELYFPNGTAVSEILVKEGLALVCFYPGNAEFYKKYLPLQRKALKQRKGIFSLIDKQPKGIVYIGNKRSRRFHHPLCPEARKIRRKVYFKSLEEAFYKGYCPSRKCFNLIFPVR
jgi:micrococcal nuclease